jgi:FlaA1/EpsC-like NDP-sugar epimerase
MANDPLNERDWVERAASMPRYLTSLLKHGVRMPVVVYRSRRTIALVLYSVIAMLAYATAFLLRFEFELSDSELLVLSSTLPLLIGIRALCYYAFGVTRARWRFAGSHDLLRLSAATVTGSFIFYVMSRGTALIPNVPRSVVAIEWGLTTYGIASWWILYRTVIEKLRFFRTDNGGRRALIVGAGEAGSMLAREMSRFPTGYRPVAFVDDDPAKIGTTIHGLHVLANTDRLAETASVMQADDIVIAVPSASPENLRRIVEKCEANDLRFKVLPGIAEVIAGQASTMHVRELRIEDLLGREPITLELPELREDLISRSVLITGAAGSIGSELARQVALHRPGILVLFDQAETGLFHLELELRERFPELQMVFLIGDVVDEVAVEKAFRAYTPSRVFHAAAYKHVPMMQTNVRQALRNNVLGTWRVADAAGRYGSDKFVLVSTDKAVDPTSVMGATKRLAEIAALEMQHRYPETNYAAVRFGNVLASAGSVIPIFQDQIARNKPLTITHPEVTRYFMTISEAVQLILQTSVRPEVSGQIAMLEMGEPIRIVDLARNLLRLSGMPYRVGQTVIFTGLRPGEKLHEELFAFDETTSALVIPKVRVVRPAKVTMSHVESLIDAWEEAFLDQRDADVAAQLSGIFPSLHGRAASPRVAEGLAVR